jgi:hypothetical protein
MRIGKLTQVVFLVWLLMIGCYAGPAAPGTWTAICSSCMTTCLATGAVYAVCIATCCATVGPLLSLFTCFDNSTMI